MKVIGEVIATHEIGCKGIRWLREKKRELPVLDYEETAIVLVYDTGKTDVLCRYFKDGFCRAEEVGPSFDPGKCPYYRK
jgi:hypothetical protein